MQIRILAALAALVLAAYTVTHFSSPANFASQVSSPDVKPDASTQAKGQKQYGKLPLSFEANQGQVDQQVKFLSRGSGYTLFLTSQAAILVLASGQDAAESGAQSEATEPAVLRMRLLDANPTASVSGVEQQPGRANYLIGNDPAKWRTNVPNFARVKYEGVYPGVDLVYYGNQQQLEYDFVLQPGANPEAILLDLQVDDATRHALDIAGNGDLVVGVRGREVRLSKPAVYQYESGNESGNRRWIDGRWTLKGKDRVGFEVAAYDASKPLIIDPALNYSTYLGGSAYDATFGLALDAAGNAYVTGDTASSDFPATTGAFQPKYGGAHDAFVTKLNASGTALVYSTYLGGNNYDRAVGIAVDSAGNAYIAGTTGSKNFPVTPGAFQTTCACPQNNPSAFVSKLDSTGANLLYSSYLGGKSSYSYGSAIAIDGAGDAFVAGRTCSPDFPVTPGAFQTTFAGGCSGTLGGDAYVTEFNPTGSGLVYSTYIGGSGVDAAYAIALDSSGNAYVSGNTNSTNFPTTTGAFQTTAGGGYDTFVAKLNPTGSALVYSTYIGGTGDDTTWGMKVDSAGAAYLAGQSNSTNFPTTTGAFQTVCANACAQTSGFVTKVDPSGASLDYSTYLGGSGSGDAAFAIALDSGNGAYVTGQTGSTSFPTTRGSFEPTSRGGVQAFVTRLNTTGTGLVYSTLFYGNSTTTGLAIAVNTAQQSFVVAGRTYSTSLPVTPTAFQQTCNNCTQTNKSSDGFIAAFGFGDQIWPLSLQFGNQVVGTQSTALTTKLSNSSNAKLNISLVQITGNSDFTLKSNTCTSTLAVGSSCTISTVFTPSAIGPENATLTVTDDATNSPQQVLLAGTGTYVQFSPGTLNFAKQTVGTQSPSKTVTLTNTGSGTLNITAIALTGTNSGDFAQTNTCGSSVTAGANCTITVTFTPTAKGARTAAISVSDDGGGSPQQVPLTGTGT